MISCDIWVPHDGPTTSLNVAQERENDRKKGKMPDPRMMMRQAQWGDPDNRQTKWPLAALAMLNTLWL